ncbi:MAG: hypothetical protein WKG07_33420 [Hymenobacter sp.]
MTYVDAAQAANKKDEPGPDGGARRHVPAHRTRRRRGHEQLRPRHYGQSQLCAGLLQERVLSVRCAQLQRGPRKPQQSR